MNYRKSGLMMTIVISITAALYGLFSSAASLTQMKIKDRRAVSLIMLCGGLMCVAAAVLKLFDVRTTAFVLLLCGEGLICVSAILNGVKNGKVHVSHHVVRIAISCALAVGFILL